MSLNSGNRVEWNDIRNIYTKLNTERQRFNFSTVTVSSKEEEPLLATDITDLKDVVDEMKSHTQLSSVVSAIEIPNATPGEIVKPTSFEKIDTLIENIQSTPTYGSNYGYNSSYHGGNYGYNSTNYGFDSANFGFDSSNNGYNNSNNIWHSGNFAYDSSNNGYNNSNNTWHSGNFAYNASNNAWHSGNFSYNKSNK